MTDIIERLRLTSPRDKTASGLLQEAADEIERLRKRLGPFGLEVVMVDGIGHYVNARVKAEIVRLRLEATAMRHRIASLKGMIEDEEAAER